MESSGPSESHSMSTNGSGDTNRENHSCCNDCKTGSGRGDATEASDEAPTPQVDIVPPTDEMDVVVATQYGRIERVRHLFSTEGINVNEPDAEGCYLLHWAAINSRVDLIK